MALAAGGTTSVSLFTLGITGATIFAGVNGPATNSGAVGVSLTNVNLELALMGATNGTTYYAVSATADMVAGVGLPADIMVGVGSLNVQINGSSDGGADAVNFDASFPNSGGNGLAVPGSTLAPLDFTQPLIQVSGSLTLSVTNFIQISGGFDFTQTAGVVDITVGAAAFTGATPLTFSLGSAASPFFSATGGVSLSFDATTFTVISASLTVNTELKIASVLEVDSLSVTLSNLSIDLATGDMTGTVGPGGAQDPMLTITAASATLFPGNSSLTGSITATTGGDGLGFQGTFDLQSGAFSITLEQLSLSVGSILTAGASNVLVTYNPADTDPHQQLVQLGSGMIDFTQFGITGSVTNLTIYEDGFHFDSVTIAYAGTVSLGSILSLTNPSVTLTDFGVTFGSGNTSFSETGSLTVSVASASLNVGSAFMATATNLSITVALDPADLGNVSVMAGMLTVQFGGIVSVSASNISINTDPANGAAYLTVGTATATVTLGSSLTLTGTASNFSVINSGGAPMLQEGTDFSVSITATPGQLGLPSWLGFQIQELQITWHDFANDPANFQLLLSASINSIQGLPGGVTVSGEITDAVIDFGRLEAGQFPITSIGSVGGSVSGTLFGLEVNASFVLGIVNFNAANQVVNSDGTVVTLTTDSTGNVTETPVSGGDTTVKSSIMYVGVAGGAMIPGLGGVQIYIGFSSLGPLTVYLSAQFPLILDPDTGIAIGGFSGGVIFDYSLPTPSQPMDLASINLSPASITISQWQQQLRDQTVTQFTSSSGGTNLSAAYSQPFLIEAGVTLYDAYLTEDAFKITGNIAIQIDPAEPDSTKIFLAGTATFGGNVSFNADLYAAITVSGATSTVNLMFLVQEPASTPVETIGGALAFGFTDAMGNPLVPTAATPTTSAQMITLPDGTTHSYTATTFSAPTTAGGFYISIDGFAQFSAFGTLSATISGSVTLTVTTTFAKIDLSGDLSISGLGDLATATGELVVDYSGGLSGLEIYGALELQTGDAFAKLQMIGLQLDGAATFVLNTTNSPQMVSLPDPMAPHDPTMATPFTITDTKAFEVTVAGVSPGTFATLAYQVGGDTVLNMQGSFDLKIGSSGLTMFADINSLSVGPSATPFLTLSGYGLFVINAQGFAAEMDLSLVGPTDIPGITLTASFTLVMNTTSTDVTYTIPSTLPPVTIPGTSTTVTSLTIPRGPPQGLLQSDGTFASVGATGPYVVITGQGDLNVEGLMLTGYF